MTALLFLALCVAGGVGSALRFVVDGLVRSRIPIAFPIGTALINVSGSFALGVLSGLTLATALPSRWELVLGTGLIGGYTTFSTATVETVRLIEDGRYRLAVTNGLAVLVVSVLVGLGGLWLGAAL